MVERGKAPLDKTRAELASIGDVDGLITKNLADAVKHAARQGNALPAMALPNDLKLKRDARAEQLEKVASAAVAVSSLEADHEDALGTLQEADRAVSACAIGVIVEEACGIGLKLSEARRTGANLTAQLQSLGGFWIAGPSGNLQPFPLPYALLSLLNEPFGLAAATGPNEPGKWQRYHARLCVDADAEL